MNFKINENFETKNLKVTKKEGKDGEISTNTGQKRLQSHICRKRKRLVAKSRYWARASVQKLRDVVLRFVSSG